MDGQSTTMAFLDSPYNVTISIVIGHGKIKHGEFAEASGEMTSDAFEEFLKTTLGDAACVVRTFFGLLDRPHFRCFSQLTKAH